MLQATQRELHGQKGWIVATENGTPERDAVVQGVQDAYAAEEYVLPDGKIDRGKVREHMFDVLLPRKVTSLRERGEKAVTRGAMVEQVFPNLPGPDAFADQEDPQLAQAVWDKIESHLWSMAQPSAGSALQRLVGFNMGNGYVLCRTKITKDQTSAVYITDNYECIERDLVSPDNDALARQIRTVERNQEMLVSRQPHNARKFQRRFNNSMKQLMSSASGQLALAVEAVTLNTEADEADEG